MRFNKNIIPATTTIMLSIPTISFAATANSANTGSEYNWTFISLVSLILALMLVIAVLANVLLQLGLAVRDKNREEKSSGPKIIKTLLMLLAFGSMAIPTMAAGNDAAPAEAARTFSGIAETDFYTIMGTLAFELLIIFALSMLIRQLLGSIRNKPELAPVAEKVAKKSWFWDKFNAAVPMEKEKDLLLDHNYDGIQELDNSLPPWWKYGFYLTIVVSIIYLYRYHVSYDGLNPQQEYAAEMQQGEEDKAAYLAKSANNVDENTVTILTDATAIADGKELFTKTCAACHLADGGGIVGPNLTDEYWLHGGSIHDVFKSIKYGWQDKGMKSWKDDFSPKQIQELASFVKSLKGTHPATPKAPQGDLYIEASEGNSTTDTTKIKTAATTAKVVAVTKQ